MTAEWDGILECDDFIAALNGQTVTVTFPDYNMWMTFPDGRRLRVFVTTAEWFAGEWMAEEGDAAMKVPATTPTPEEFAATIAAIPGTGNCWDSGEHHDADDAVCALLRQLGYGAAVDLIESTHRWYS